MDRPQVFTEQQIRDERFRQSYVPKKTFMEKIRENPIPYAFGVALVVIIIVIIFMALSNSNKTPPPPPNPFSMPDPYKNKFSCSNHNGIAQPDLHLISPLSIDEHP